MDWRYKLAIYLIVQAWYNGGVDRIGSTADSEWIWEIFRRYNWQNNVDCFLRRERYEENWSEKRTIIVWEETRRCARWLWNWGRRTDMIKGQDASGSHMLSVRNLWDIQLEITLSISPQLPTSCHAFLTSLSPLPCSLALLNPTPPNLRSPIAIRGSK